MSDCKFNVSSLREHLIEDIKKFLQEEGFRSDECTLKGILALINSISDYYEEGKRLYPEVVLTTDMTLFKTMPSYIIPIKTAPLSIDSFKNALKLCAPLAVDRWIIYIEIKEEELKFGLLSTETTETSLSMYRQTLDSEMFPENSTFAYIRSLGQKIVEIRGIRNGLHVYLNLDADKELHGDYIANISSCIVSEIEDGDQETIAMYVEKLIDEAIKAGHGNLIGVVEDKTDKIEKISEDLHDGIYLEIPIDLADFINQAESEKTNESSVRLTAHSSLVRSMLNHDGITLFTTKGRLIGYHLFIKDHQEDQNLVGGARSRAFEAMKRLELKACLYKSQDGRYLSIGVVW